MTEYQVILLIYGCGLIVLMAILFIRHLARHSNRSKSQNISEPIYRVVRIQGEPKRGPKEE